MDETDTPSLDAWIGTSQTCDDPLPAFPARALAALLGHAAAAPPTLPLPWHWLYALTPPVVHRPSVRSTTSTTAAARFSFRAERQAFGCVPVQLHADAQGDHIALWSADDQGRVGVRAQLYLAPA